LHLAAGAAALPAVSRFAWAQAYPSRPLRCIVAYAPGGGTDIFVRLVGQPLSERLGQPFVIENRPGAASNIATEAVVRAPADGYTLLGTDAAAAINATLYDNLNFNFVRDIAAVAIIQGPLLVTVHPSVPAKTVPEFIAYAKANPGKVSMASAGSGSPPHLAGELFKVMTKVDMTHVPYRGGGPAVSDLVGGQVQVYFGSFSLVIEHIRADKLRALAVTTPARFESLPDIPTVGEFVPDYVVVRHGLAQEYARGDHRPPQQGGGRRSYGRQDTGAACRSGLDDVPRLAGRARNIHRRRNREVGQGDPGGQHQGRLMR
jgi:tripartite-type tricarboxylate transporter receptor subunit TctC